MRTAIPRNTRHKKNDGTPRPVKVAAMLLLPLLVAAVVACDTGTGTAPANTPTTAAVEPYANSPEGKPPLFKAGQSIPDPKEALETKPAGQLPDFISQADPNFRTKVTTLYQGAMDHYDAYGHVPCYCGCAIYATPHMSLAECFIKNKADNGDLTFTDHSLTCDLCQTAAQMTVDGLAQNTPLKDLRSAIFAKLKYTRIWTDTPPVQ